MTAALVTVGSELLRAGRPDSNAEWLITRLHRLGVDVVARSSAIDDDRVLVEQLRAAARCADLVITTGGLGPTEDDRTRQALASAFALPLERDASEQRRLELWYGARGSRVDLARLRQALRPRSAAWLPNDVGSAAGLWLEAPGCRIVALPGVPGEMRAMFDGYVVRRLEADPVRGQGGMARVCLRVAGRTESSVDEQLKDLYGIQGGGVTILAGEDGVDLHLWSLAPVMDEARDRVEATAREMRGRLGADLYGVGSERLAAVVGRLLRERGAVLAVAESCTGGMLGASITDVAGSSAWFRGGIVAYADRVKVDFVEVPSALIERHGAVSREVALALARGALARFEADFALAITGIAGPGGATPDKPVGTVHLALADGATVQHRERRIGGGRRAIRRRSVAHALDLLRRRLQPGGPV